MNELLADTRFWLVTLGAAIVGLMKYLFMQHKAETKERLDKIEADSVRRAEFNQLRADFQGKHEENVGRLDDGFARIEALIERNHTDAVEGRHRAANQILTLVGQVALLEGRMQSSQRGDDR